MLVPLSRGFFATIQSIDLPLVGGYRWAAVPKENGMIYARAYAGGGRSGQRFVYMHRLLCEAPGLVDHANRDGLDNRRCNLRPATKSQNTANSTSRHALPKGVSFDAKRGKFAAFIKGPSRKTIGLGRYPTAAEASAAYMRAARRLFGEFARAK